MIKQEEVFKVGRFAKPHGIKGELSLQTASDLFDGENDVPYVICEMDGILVPFFVEEQRYKSDSVVLLKLEDVDSDEAARPFVNKDVYYPLSEVDPEDLAADMTWDSFIGYEVVDAHAGRLGVVEAVDESTLNVLFRIECDGAELLIPAVEEFISWVDQAEKRLEVSLPDGLLEL